MLGICTVAVFVIGVYSIAVQHTVAIVAVGADIVSVFIVFVGKGSGLAAIYHIIYLAEVVTVLIELNN